MEVGEQITRSGRVVIERAGPVRALPPTGIDPETVGRLEIRSDGIGAAPLDALLDRLDAHSLVVLHDGGLAYEWFRPGQDPDRRRRCYSVTKSFTGTLAATAVHDGELDRAAIVGDLLPELTATGFGDATVGEVLDMTTSLAYDEDYEQIGALPDATRSLGFGDYAIALGLEPGDEPLPDDAPKDIRSFLAAIGPAGRHGERFTYATPNTDVVGWLLERALGRTYAELFREQLWAPTGAEHDAVLGLDPIGLPVMAAGLSMTTRDLARFGQLLVERCQPDAPDEPAAIPRSVLERIRDGGDPDAFQRGGHYAYLTGYSYRDQWWMPGGSARPLSAWGIHGQFLWVDPDARLVVAGHTGGASASDAVRDLAQDAICRTLTVALA